MTGSLLMRCFTFCAVEINLLIHHLCLKQLLQRQAPLTPHLPVESRIFGLSSNLFRANHHCYIPHKPELTYIFLVNTASLPEVLLSEIPCGSYTTSLWKRKNEATVLRTFIVLSAPEVLKRTQNSSKLIFPLN